MCNRIEVMRTKENYRGQSFEVTFDKVFEVVRPKYTFKFVLKREEAIEGKNEYIFFRHGYRFRRMMRKLNKEFGLGITVSAKNLHKRV